MNLQKNKEIRCLKMPLRRECPEFSWLSRLVISAISQALRVPTTIADYDQTKPYSAENLKMAKPGYAL